MAPSKKSRSANKRISSFDEVSPDKDLGNSSKGRQRKRKLSDMLGSQWSKEELEHFYEAYRKYGKDWKKVAAIVCNRSVEMVEALYNMNRAYLSLPEGTASVVGLIAMMTDHYNVLGGSESERESNDALGISRRPQKRGRANVHLSTSKDDLSQSPSAISNDGCLSLLKRRHSNGRVVGKRTPRFPVSYSYKKRDGETYVSLNHKGRKSGADANDDSMADRAAALALTEASLRGSSPQASPYRRVGHVKSSPAQNREREGKVYGLATDEGFLEDNLGSRDADNGNYVRDTNSLMCMEGVGTVEAPRRGKKFHEKREDDDVLENTNFDDGREACSGTEEGLSMSATKEKIDLEASNIKIEWSPPQGQRKRSKKQLFGDEASAIDALQALADLSVMMPASTIESESSSQIKDEKTSDVVGRLGVLEPMSTRHQRVKSRQPGGKTLHPIPVAEISTPRKSKPARDSESDANDHTEVKSKSHSASKALKRKRKLLPAKISANNDIQSSEPLKAQPPAEEEDKSIGHRSPCSKQWTERSLSLTYQRRAGTNVTASTVEYPATKQVISPIKQRSRRKMDPRRVTINNEINTLEKNEKYRTARDAASIQETVEQLSFCLSSPMVRRWCTFEWFYGSIDYPWFAKREFVEYLNHVGLGHIPRLTRVEWGVIRSSLGKPRRFSERFLHEEKAKLKQYRECVRLHYAELRSGTRDGLPTDLARPLSVGQRVVAIHPRTREIYDGSILTVDHKKCRVQFDHPEVGVEFVMDVDCMPLVPLESMPEAIKRQDISMDKSYSNGPRLNGQSNTGGSLLFASSEHPENTHNMSLSDHSTNTLVKHKQGDTVSATSQAKAGAAEIVNAKQAVNSQSCAMAQAQAREADVQALSELTRALDKKEALLEELKHANSDVLESQINGVCFLKDSEPFKKHYASVSSAILHLRQRNTFPGNSLPLWFRQPAVSNGPGAPPSSTDNVTSNSHEAGSNVVEIVKGSRLKAFSMVDAAIQAMSSMKEGEDVFARISEALNCVNRLQDSSDSGMSMARSPDPVNNSLAHHNNLTSCTPERLFTGHASDSKLLTDSDNNEVEVPAELITSCVAALLMVQMCTERQYPPADVAQILDSAVSSLYPCCPQNLPIYREIQMCMGRIKTQILALIPT